MSRWNNFDKFVRMRMWHNTFPTKVYYYRFLNNSTKPTFPFIAPIQFISTTAVANQNIFTVVQWDIAVRFGGALNGNFRFSIPDRMTWSNLFEKLKNRATALSFPQMSVKVSFGIWFRFSNFWRGDLTDWLTDRERDRGRWGWAFECWKKWKKKIKRIHSAPSVSLQNSGNVACNCPVKQSNSRQVFWYDFPISENIFGMAAELFQSNFRATLERFYGRSRAVPNMYLLGRIFE